jgi:hypothetical protein
MEELKNWYQGCRLAYEDCRAEDVFRQMGNGRRRDHARGWSSNSILAAFTCNDLRHSGTNSTTLQNGHFELSILGRSGLL